jgi:3-oxoacyl-[acyl-carrier-protein] synthase-3
MKYNNVTIKGVGAYLPEYIMGNDELLENINTTSEWVENKLGISERRVMKNETQSDMALKATINALKDANITKDELDLIIIVTSSPEQISPSTACILNNKLGLNKNVPSFDINAVCAGFVYALSISAPLISTKTYKNILVVATEAYSTITDYNNRNCIFFGDGAGAVILGYSETGSITSKIEANGSGTGMTGFYLKHGEKYNTNPKEVWNQAINVLPKSINDILALSDLTIGDIDYLIPHQASINMLKLIAEEIGLPESKLTTVMDKYGNIAGASIPIALDYLKRKGKLKHGNNILLTAIGSGWAWGSIILKYGEC